MAYTKDGKYKLYEGFLDALFGVHIYNSNGNQVNARQVGHDFRTDIAQEIADGKWGADSSDDTLPMEFRVAAGEDVKYVAFSEGYTGSELAVYELTEAEDFPNGGTFIVDEIAFDLNEGVSHSEPTVPS